MLSTDTRLKLQDIASRIAGGLNVTFEEMQWAQKWADHNKSAASILRKGRRKAFTGETEDGSLDSLLEGMDLGDPDPSNHLIGPQDPTDLADWFKREDTSEESDWRTRD